MNYRIAAAAIAAFVSGIFATLVVLGFRDKPEPTVEDLGLGLSQGPFASIPRSPLIVRTRTEERSFTEPVKTRSYENSPGERVAWPIREDRESHEPLSREELAERAELIQATSERRLARLTADLNLTEEQQDQIFGILARSSPAFHPSLEIRVANAVVPTDSSSAGWEASKVEDRIFETLDEEQADLLADELIDRDRWWTDIIGALEQDFDRSVGNVPARPDESTPVSPETPIQESAPQRHEGRNLSDVLDGS